MISSVTCKPWVELNCSEMSYLPRELYGNGPRVLKNALAGFGPGPLLLVPFASCSCIIKFLPMALTSLSAMWETAEDGFRTVRHFSVVINDRNIS